MGKKWATLWEFSWLIDDLDSMQSHTWKVSFLLNPFCLWLTSSISQFAPVQPAQSTHTRPNVDNKAESVPMTGLTRGPWEIKQRWPTTRDGPGGMRWPVAQTFWVTQWQDDDRYWAFSSARLYPVRERRLGFAFGREATQRDLAKSFLPHPKASPAP